MQQKKHSKRLIIPIFINHKGCKHRCIFCNQKSAVEHSISSLDEIPNIINSYISTQINKFRRINPKYKKVQIAFYGGSFTCLTFDMMERYFEMAISYIKKGIVDSIRISTRPDCINEDVLNFLKEFKVETIELGCESFDDNVLNILKRGHSVNDIIDSSNLIKKRNFELALQLMIGVPGETKKTHENNFLYLKKIKPVFLRIFPLIVLKNTELEKLYYNGKFKPLKLNEAIEILCKYFKFCEENGIKIIQMGLHYSDHLLKNYVAGPLHPSLKDLVIKQIMSKGDISQ